MSQKYELSISNSSRIVDGSLMMGCMNVNVMVICAFRILREIAMKPLKGSCGFGLTVYLWHPQAQVQDVFLSAGLCYKTPTAQSGDYTMLC